MLPPKSTGLGVALLVMLKSDCVAPATVTFAVADAAVGLGLGVAEFAWAVLEITVPLATPVEGTFTTSVNVAVAPFKNVGAGGTVLHAIFPVPPTNGALQLQLAGGVMETKVVLVGTVS